MSTSMGTGQDMNFLPEDYIEKRAAHRHAVIFIGLFLAVMGGIVAAYFLTERERSGVLLDLDKVNQELDRKGRELAEYKQMRAEKEAMHTKVELTAQLMERVWRSVLLTELHRALGTDTKLTQLQLQTKEVQIVRPMPRPGEDPKKLAAEMPRPQPEVNIELMGLAPSHEHVAVFLDRLGKLDLVKDAKPVFSEEYKHDGDVTRRFKVTMRVNPEADTRLSKTVAKGR